MTIDSLAEQDAYSAAPASQIQLAHLKTIIGYTNFLDERRDYFAFCMLQSIQAHAHSNAALLSLK
jgi:hypothetical protein